MLSAEGPEQEGPSQHLSCESLMVHLEETLRYRLFMSGPGRQRWEDNRRFFTKEFQKYVDQQLESGSIEQGGSGAAAAGG